VEKPDIPITDPRGEVLLNATHHPANDLFPAWYPYRVAAQPRRLRHATAVRGRRMLLHRSPVETCRHFANAEGGSGSIG
jgi:hypothetical protein